MTLPPKALSVLVDIKKELLSQSVMIIPALPNVPVLPVLSVPSVRTETPHRAGVMITRMRHARVRNRAFQIMCQRGEW